MRSGRSGFTHLPVGARLFIASQGLSAVGDQFVPFALAQFRGAGQGLGVVAVSYGSLMAAKSIMTAIVLPLAGVAADRRSRVAVAIAGDVAQGAGVLLAALGMARGGSLLIGLIGCGLLGAGDGAFRAVGNAIVPALVQHDQRQTANGLMGSALHFAAVFGPAVGVGVVSAIGPEVALGLNALTFVVSLFIMLRLRRMIDAHQAQANALSGKDGQVGFLGSLASGVREIRRVGWILPIEALSLIHITLCVAPFFILMPALLISSDNSSVYALILGGFASGRVLGGFVAGSLRPRLPAVWMLGGQMLFALGPLTAALFGPPYWPVAVAMAIAGVGLQIADTTFYTLLQDSVRPTHLSRVISSVQLISLALMPIGQSLTGPARSLLGTSAVLLAGGVAMLGTGLLPLLSPQVRDIGRVATATVDSNQPAMTATAAEP